MATPANDRTVTVAGQSNCRATDWSATNRLALVCGGNFLVTASDFDGSDVRVVTGTPCTVLPCTFVGGGVFSPSGTHLVLSEITFTSISPQVVSAVVLGVAPDAASAPVTPIVTTDTTHLAAPISWR